MKCAEGVAGPGSCVLLPSCSLVHLHFCDSLAWTARALNMFVMKYDSIGAPQAIADREFVLHIFP